MFHTIMEKWDLKLWIYHRGFLQYLQQIVFSCSLVQINLASGCCYKWAAICLNIFLLAKQHCQRGNEMKLSMSLHFLVCMIMNGLYTSIFINSFLLNKGMSKVNCLLRIINSMADFCSTVTDNMFTERLCGILLSMFVHMTEDLLDNHKNKQIRSNQTVASPFKCDLKCKSLET